MVQSTKILDELLDYVHQLRRHTSDRRALHIKLSSLERHMHDPSYRREVASALRPLVAKRGAKLFALPNADFMLVTFEVSLDDLSPPIVDMQKRLKESKFLARLDPVIGLTDPFIEWFDLETDYGDFAAYTERLAEQIRASVFLGGHDPVVKSAAGEKNAGTPAVGVSQTGAHDDRGTGYRPLDAFILASALRKLPAADISPALRDQKIMAIVASNVPTPVLVHKTIDIPWLVNKLTGVSIDGSDHWLEGYFAEEIALKLLALQPSLKNDTSIATSLRLASAAVFSDEFDAFDAAIDKAEKSSIILEFSLIDILASPRQYSAACEKIEQQGYKISLADVEPETLLWLDYAQLHASFIKLRTPQAVPGEWLLPEREQQMIERISKIGRTRVILADCTVKADIAQGQKLGITLFQGSYFS